MLLRWRGNRYVVEGVEVPSDARLAHDPVTIWVRGASSGTQLELSVMDSAIDALTWVGGREPFGQRGREPFGQRGSARQTAARL